MKAIGKIWNGEIMKKMLLIILILACGCKSDIISSQKLEKSSSNNNIPMNDGNNAASIVVAPQVIIPSGNQDIIYQINDGVYIGNPQTSDEMIRYCNRPDCKHNSEDCYGYIGAVERFLSYQDTWYYSKKNNNTSQFIAQNPSTNERNILCSFESYENNNEFHDESINDFFVSYDKVFITVNVASQNINDPDKDSYSSIIYMYQLKNDTMTKFLEYGNGLFENYYVCGGYGNSIVIQHTVYSENPEEDVKQLNELQIYDIDKGYLKTISSTEDGFWGYSDPYAHIYDGTLIYQKNNELWKYDFDTDTESHIYSAEERIVNSCIYGENIYFITRTDDLQYEFYTLKISDRTLYAFKNNGRKDALYFSYCYPTENGIIGIMNDKYVWLLESDYLHENYANAIEMTVRN